MPATERVALEGSRPLDDDRQRIKAVDDDHEFEVLLILRDQGSAPPTEAFTLGSTRVKEREHLDHEQMRECSGASEADLAAVRAFAKAHDLTVVQEKARACMVVLRGTKRGLDQAFGIELHHYQMGKELFHSHDGDVHIPRELDGIVQAVFGLDGRVVARRAGKDESAENPVPPPPVDEHTRLPSEFKSLYAFPENANGKGECIALLQFQGGFDPDKLRSYLERLGVDSAKIIVREVGQGRNAPVNKPGDVFSEDIEVYMDIEIAASVAPAAKIVVYFGENSDKGWVETVNAAIFDTEHRPSVVSISYGMAESYWHDYTVRVLDDSFRRAAHLGVTICCSSGDFGVYEANESKDPAFTVAFPASSPHVLACGGTRLETADGAIHHEAVWNQSDVVPLASGGGVSRVHELPPYQSGIGVPPHEKTKKSGRGLPDVAANASTLTGYVVYADDTEMSMGGTSAAAPLWASFIACLNESLGHRIGYLTPLLYTREAQAADALRNIVHGDNKNLPMGNEGYVAQSGWDPCTGLGVPNGEQLLNWLKGR